MKTGYTFLIDSSNFSDVEYDIGERFLCDLVTAINQQSFNKTEFFIADRDLISWNFTFKDQPETINLLYANNIISRIWWDCSEELRVIGVDCNPVGIPEDLDVIFPKTHNAFWGIYNPLPSDRHIYSYSDYVVFKKNNGIRLIEKSEFWNKKEELFPRFIFCESVKDAMKYNSQYFEILVDLLVKLHDFCEESWAEEAGHFDYVIAAEKVPGNLRDESNSVKTDPDLKKHRKFKMPDGASEYVYMHMSVGGSKGKRIYIKIDENMKKITIAYFGNHLPTKKFPK